MDPWLFRRISVRYLRDGEAFDVIGRVIDRTNDEVTLMRRDGRVEKVHVTTIAAAREVPEDDRRHRDVTTFAAETVLEMVARVSGSLGDTHQLLVAELPPADVDATFDDQATTATYTNERVSARFSLCGDWLAIDTIHAAFGSAAAADFTDLIRHGANWARPRGAVHAWALVDSETSTASVELLALGFTRIATNRV